MTNSTKVKAFPIFTWDSCGFRTAHEFPLWERSALLKQVVDGLVMYLVDTKGTSEVVFDAYKPRRR